MSRHIEISDDAYEALAKMAADQGHAPAALVELWIAYQLEGYRQPEHTLATHPRFYTTDAWFRHLGMSDEEIAAVDADAEDDGPTESRERRDATGADA